MPTKGNVKIFALLIDFLDYPGYSTRDQIHSALFGDGSILSANVYPYESFRNYYLRSSYGQLDLSSGLTLGWYHAPYNRSAVPMTTAGRESLIKEALLALGGSVDFSQFDNDGNGQIEYFAVVWTGPNNGWSNFWWGYQTSFSETSYTINGKRLGKYSWQWEGSYGAYGPFSPSTVIHETGHGLGLPDLYDYDNTQGPNGGVGKLDMMDGNWGDHNCFSKWVLDWLTPTIVNSGSQNLTINPAGTSTDAILIMPGANFSNPFSEFFIAQNRSRTGNDLTYPSDGMLIWHVDATLNSSGTNYKYDNSYTVHKLVKLMEADGLERIETSSARADAAMYYNPGMTFGSTTTPSSKNYQGVFSHAQVTCISLNLSQMTATFSIEEPGTGGFTLTIVKAGAGNGLVSSDKTGISCGNDCVDSYVNGEVITLTAAAVFGSEFSGWSGGGCYGTGSCIVNLMADTTVAATFASTLVLNEDFDPESSNPPFGWTTITNSGTARWWFTYDFYNDTGGTGECALGATYGSTSSYDTELRTPAINLAYFSSVGVEFKSGLRYSGVTADVDVSVNGASGPWTNVWRKTVVSREGPQTYNINLTSVVTRQSNVMLRFHVYGTSPIWWAIDDIRVTATTTIKIDFNDDGKPDILWRNNSTGENAVWHLDGVSWLSSAWLPAVTDQSWTIVGAGDFNNDGKTDVLWRNTSTGANAVWSMDGESWLNTGWLPGVTDQSWKIVGTGDFNNDGKTDILWRNPSTGANAVWSMDGESWLSTGWLPAVTDQSWRIVGTGDFNNDGKTDILWRNTSTGENAVWYLDGVNWLSTGWLPGVTDQSWAIVGTGDFNNDGKTDILWRNTSTGANAAWYLDGVSWLSSGWLPAVTDQSWRVVGR